MEFTEIDDNNSVFPGEYIYHEPSSAIVLAGAFNREEDFIRALKHGRYLEDKISTMNEETGQVCLNIIIRSLS